MTESDGLWVTDLTLVVLITVLAGYAILLGVGGPVRILLAMSLVLVLPGYAATAALFPANNGPDAVGRRADEVDGLRNPLPADYELDGVERLVLTVTLSVVAIPAVALALDVIGWGIDLEGLLRGTVGLTLALVLVGFVRRLRLPPERRFRTSVLRSITGWWPAPNRKGKLEPGTSRPAWFAPVMVASLLLLGASVAYAGIAPPADDGFTEFYVDTEDVTGSTSSVYPSTFEVGEERSIAIGVGNHERRDVEYTVVVLQQRVVADDGGTEVRREEELVRRELTVADGETQRVDLAVEPTFSGSDVRLLLLLYEGEPPADLTEESAYRVLDLDVTVSEGDQPDADGGSSA